MNKEQTELSTWIKNRQNSQRE